MLAAAVKVLVTKLPKAVALMVLSAALSAESVEIPPLILVLPVVSLVTEEPPSRLCADAMPTLALLTLVTDMLIALVALLPLLVTLKVLSLNDSLLEPMLPDAALR